MKVKQKRQGVLPRGNLESIMRLLAIGDVCGPCGCEEIKKRLPALKRGKNIDLTVINCENSAEGNGVTKDSAESLFAYGADVLTGGNHSFRRKQVYGYLDENGFILRPHNITDAAAGKGYCLVDLGYVQAAVINLAGRVFIERQNASCPFCAADELIDRAKKDGAGIIAVDFHAEATSEKRALGIYLDGRVSAVFGTHTHVQTADNAILKNGTGYITDLGMTGAADSVLGVESEIIINRLKNGDTAKFKQADGRAMLNGCIFDINTKTGLAEKTERVYITE